MQGQPASQSTGRLRLTQRPVPPWSSWKEAERAIGVLAGVQNIELLPGKLGGFETKGGIDFGLESPGQKVARGTRRVGVAINAVFG